MESRLTEIKTFFPNCTVSSIETDTEQTIIIQPPETDHSAEYCAVLTDYIETLGFQTELKIGQNPYIKAKPLESPTLVSV